MARQSKYLIALSKQIEQERIALQKLYDDRDATVSKLTAVVSAQEGKLDALVNMRHSFEKMGQPKKKAAPLKAVTAAQ